MASKGKEVFLLGAANIDFKKIATNNSLSNIPLEKCEDKSAEITLSISIARKHHASSE